MTVAFPLLALRMTMSGLDLIFLRARNSSLDRLGLGGFACLKIFEQSCRISSASWGGRWRREFSILQRMSSKGKWRGDMAKLRPLSKRSKVVLSKGREERLTTEGGGWKEEIGSQVWGGMLELFSDWEHSEKEGMEACGEGGGWCGRAWELELKG